MTRRYFLEQLKQVKHTYLLFIRAWTLYLGSHLSCNEVAYSFWSVDGSCKSGLYTRFLTWLSPPIISLIPLAHWLSSPLVWSTPSFDSSYSTLDLLIRLLSFFKALLGLFLRARSYFFFCTYSYNSSFLMHSRCTIILLGAWFLSSSFSDDLLLIAFALTKYHASSWSS